MTDPFPSECDVAVIGAGIAGLTAAALLSKAGLDVVVLEAGSKAGGYMAGFERSGFTFDTAIQWLNQCKPEGLVSSVFGHLKDDYPKCRPLRRIHRYKSSSYDYLLTSNPDQMRDRLIEDFPDEGEGIQKLFSDSKKIGKHQTVLNNRLRTMDTMSVVGKIWYGLKMLHWVIPVWKHLRTSAEEVLNRYFKGEDIKKIFCSDDTQMSILVPIGWAYLGDFQAPPKGGSLVFIQWLCERIQSSGSRVLLKRRVEKVLVEGNRAVGIHTADGQTLRSRYVLAACDVESLYEGMLPVGQVSSKLCTRLRKADLYPSNFTLFIALDCDVASLGFNEETVNLRRDDISRAEQAKGDPHTTYLTVLAPSFRDPSLAPEGKGILTIHCPAFLEYSGMWRTEEGLERGPAYREFKQEYCAVLLDRVEKALAPGLRDHIEFMEIATPVTYRRYTDNRAGSIMGARPTRKNIKNRISHYRTPVQNLLLGGQWAEYGGGVPMAVRAAANSSLIILKDLKKAAYKDLRDVIDGKRKNTGILC